MIGIATWVGIGVVIIAMIIAIISFIKLRSQKTDYRKLLSQKKKSEVNLGYISEKLAPFLDGFNYDPNRLIFIGKPIDYIHFGEEEITFIEVKSGNSRLTKGQRKIRNLVKENKIKWDEYRVSSKPEATHDSTPPIQQ